MKTLLPFCAQVVAKHDAPVRHVFYSQQLGSGMLITGSWDKTVRYWDLRWVLP